jgi:NAD(P)-dependent dehydrogenase (short-subunit alcohol dehydrogenase family)
MVGSRGMGALDSFSVAGRVALVTGGSAGLGKAMARGLAEAGADVAIAARRRDVLDGALAEILDGTGRRGLAVVADFSRRGEAERVAREVLGELGRVDILVSNAGANTPQAIDEVTDEVWDQVLDTHVHTAMALTRALAPQMKQRGWGRVVYISSGLGVKGMERRSAYTTAKSALMGLARSAAIDLGPFGITVNCLAPGMFLTDALRWLSDEQRSQLEAAAALERAAEPEELVGPLLLLASDAGSYLSGTTLLVDGGWLIK